MNIEDLAKHVDTKEMLERPLHEWRQVLAKECQVYVLGENYLAKRFDEVNYKLCEKNEAKEILIDNLYAILRYEYFTERSEDIDARINEIVKSVTTNLKTTLKKVSIDPAEDGALKMIPDCCVAFANGVFDFKTNSWLFKYDIYEMDDLNNRIYRYDPSYVIFWYLKINFVPLDIYLYKMTPEMLLETYRKISEAHKNYCFELIWNMSHDINDKFSMRKFIHLCEVIGYVLLPSFCEQFVFFIGAGGNGKNSLFDGCFSSKVNPMPTSNNLDEIEENQFITGTLENRSHNFFFEADPKVYSKSTMLKQLTGSMYQAVERKGVQKYSSLINCKYVFSANDQDNVKFGDMTTGFVRRVDMIEIYYKWDASKLFMKRGDYYDTTFSDTLNEIKSDVANTIAFVYFGMMGLMQATDNFAKPFKFTENDYNMSYGDIDLDLKTKIDRLTILDFVKYAEMSKRTYEEFKLGMFDLNETKLFNSISMKRIAIKSYEEMLKMFKDEELSTSYFLDNDFYLSIRILQDICRDLGSATAFTQSIKKIYQIDRTYPVYGNKPYVKASFKNGRLKIYQR